MLPRSIVSLRSGPPSLRRSSLHAPDYCAPARRNEEGSIRRAGPTEGRHHRGWARRIDPCWTEPLGGAGLPLTPWGLLAQPGPDPALILPPTTGLPQASPCPL